MRCIRKLNLGAVSLVRGRVKNDIFVLSKIRDEVENLLNDEFFKEAPFDCVGMIIRYGNKTDLRPQYQAIENGELPVAVEVNLKTLRGVSLREQDELAEIFRRVLLETLLSIATKYKLPTAQLSAELQKSTDHVAGIH